MARMQRAKTNLELRYMHYLLGGYEALLGDINIIQLRRDRYKIYVIESSAEPLSEVPYPHSPTFRSRGFYVFIGRHYRIEALSERL